MSQRLRKSFCAFFDFIWSGTVFRYFMANWQYGLFFLFPYLLLCLFATVACVAAFGILGFITPPGVVQTAVALVLGIVIFFGLLQWPGRRWRVAQGLDDWIF